VIWEIVFMLVILKIPVVYMCAIVWWAVRAEPRPFEGAARLEPLDPPPACDWRGRTLRPSQRPGLGGGRVVGARRTALLRASRGPVMR
jgi:hypothetical protein